MRRLVLLLLLACLLLFPSTVPEVAAEPEPTVPAPEPTIPPPTEYKTYLPTIFEIAPNSDLVCMPRYHGEDVNFVRNPTDQSLII
jgi:hypothetical protein